MVVVVVVITMIAVVALAQNQKAMKRKGSRPKAALVERLPEGSLGLSLLLPLGAGADDLLCAGCSLDELALCTEELGSGDGCGCDDDGCGCDGSGEGEGGTGEDDAGAADDEGFDDGTDDGAGDGSADGVAEGDEEGDWAGEADDCAADAAEEEEAALEDSDGSSGALSTRFVSALMGSGGFVPSRPYSARARATSSMLTFTAVAFSPACDSIAVTSMRTRPSVRCSSAASTLGTTCSLARSPGSSKLTEQLPSASEHVLSKPLHLPLAHGVPPGWNAAAGHCGELPVHVASCEHSVASAHLVSAPRNVSTLLQHTPAGHSPLAA